MNSGREQTSCTISVCKEDLKQGVDIITDVITNLPTANLEKVKGSILQNLDEAEQPTRSVIDDRLHTCAFRDYALGFSCIGPFDGIEGITQDHLAAYVGANYTADRMVLAAVGP